MGSRFRVVLVGAALLLVAVGVCGTLRVPVLTALGRLVVEERAPSRSDRSSGSQQHRLGAAEAAELYRPVMRLAWWCWNRCTVPTSAS